MSEDKDKLRSQVTDRNLRAFGADAQRSLEQGSVCLVNATAAGAEALKSLILPGVGKFTIVDNNLVTVEDLGQNFFVTEEDVGKSRAEAVTEHLLLHAILLNKENSKGINKDPVELLKTDPKFFVEYDVIILSGVSLEAVALFNEFAINFSVSLVVVRSYGQIAVLQLFSPEHVIYNNRTNSLYKFSVDAPWKELEEYAISLSSDKVTIGNQRHIPFPIILINTLREFKTAKKINKLDYASQNEFTKFIYEYESIHCLAAEKRQKDPSNPSPEPENEIEHFFEGWHFNNYEEAVKYYYYAKPQKTPNEVLDVFKRLEEREKNGIVEKGTNRTSRINAKFWKLIKALHVFYLNHNKTLPVNPSFPDMVASTRLYVDLKNIYKKRLDLEVLELVDIYKKQGGVVLEKEQPNDPADAVYFQDFQNLASKAYFLAVIPYTPVFQFVPKPPKEGDHFNWVGAIGEEFPLAPTVPISHSSEEQKTTRNDLVKYFGYLDDSVADHVNQFKNESNLAYVPIVHACEIFRERYQRYPGNSGATPSKTPLPTYSADLAVVRSIVKEISALYHLPLALGDSSLVDDVVRSEGRELHTISAAIGAMASQEAFKFIVHQFTPADNTVVFNGYFGFGVTAKLY